MKAFVATRNRARLLGGAGLLIVVGTIWALHHVQSILRLTGDGDDGNQFGLLYAFAFVVFSWQTFLAYLEVPYRVTNRQSQQLAQLFVAVNVPVYNEDPDAVVACLKSLMTQTRPPQLIYVVDDGSTKADYSGIAAEAFLEAKELGIQFRWERQKNGGKRSAQARTFSSCPEADIFMTVDSDTILDARAIEEGLKPFYKQDIMSVAGVVLSANTSTNLLTRTADLLLVAGQLTARSSLSAFGSVLVNSGPIAFYRAHIIRDALAAYLHETFFGRPVHFSDDSMLTTYAIQHGRTVQQPTAFAFCLMPDTLQHHVLQYLRWMRGSFIRTWWRFKYLPLDRYAFWIHAAGWLQMVISTMLFFILFIVQPFIDPRVIPFFVVIPILLAYLQSLRYLSVTRSDLTLGAQLFIFAITPVAALWAFFGLRFIRWYAICTCLKTGAWGTREEIEVRLVNAKPEAAVRADLAATTTH